MPFAVYIISVILGIVEGLTEFLPISSTGHLIVAGDLLRFNQLMGDPDRAELFEVVIQLGAILAVGYLFRQRLFSSLTAKNGSSDSGRLRTYLIVAFLPAAILGFLFHTAIKNYLFSSLSVAISLIVGGIIIIMIEKFTKEEKRTTTVSTMTMKDALVIGFAQVLSLIPGTSRSASTIMGGMLGGMTRPAATEFSFLLSFPVMIAASGYELLKYRHLLHADMLGILGVGFITAFVSALVVVAWLIRFVQRHSFTGFGIYRILLGALILILLSAHVLGNAG